MNMFAKNESDNVQEYLENVSSDRKPAIDFLHEFIQNTAPSLKVYFAYNMLGYGSFKYLNYKKQEIDWPVIAMANQKKYISIYVCALSDDGKYIAEENKDKLGKVSVGKSCIRFKKIEDVNLDELAKVIKLAEKSPGLNTNR